MSSFFSFVHETEISYEFIDFHVFETKPSDFSRYQLDTDLKKKEIFCWKYNCFESRPPLGKSRYWMKILSENLESSEKHILMSVFFDLLSEDKCMFFTSKLRLYEMSSKIIAHDALSISIEIDHLHCFYATEFSDLFASKSTINLSSIYGKKFWWHEIFSIIETIATPFKKLLK